MPFYEYRCEDCGQKNSLFKSSIREAETAQVTLCCERCGSAELRRLLSRFGVGRATRSEGEELYQFDRMTAGLSADEPQQLSRWAHTLSDNPAEEAPKPESITNDPNGSTPVD